MTGEFKKILVGLDLSAYTGETLRCALELSRGLDAELIVLNVVHQRDVDALNFIQGSTEMVDADQVMEQRRQDRQAQAQDLLKFKPECPARSWCGWACPGRPSWTQWRRPELRCW